MQTYQNSGSSQNVGFETVKTSCPCGKGENFTAFKGNPQAGTCWKPTCTQGTLNKDGSSRTVNFGTDVRSASNTFIQQYSKPQGNVALKPQPEKPKPSHYAFIEKYIYSDENDVPLFDVHRKEGRNKDGSVFKDEKGFTVKTFLQFKAGTSKPIGNTRRVLYRLRSVLNAIQQGETIYIVEGEKDVHTLEQRGLVATCNAGGSGKGIAVFSDTLRNANVVILPDNDGPGKHHAELLVNSLVGIAASVKVVKLPNLPQKGDVTDFFNNGGTLEQLLKEVEETPEISQEIQPEQEIPLFTVMTANEFLEYAKNKPVPKMLFSEFFHQSEVCIFFASTNVGKTILAVQIGESIASGIPIRGFKMTAEPQKVLYFDFEMSSKQFQNRYSLNYTINYQFSNNFIRVEINPKGIIPERFKNFEEYLYFSLEKTIKETGAKIVIVDNITFLKSGTETAKDALPLIKYLKALTNKHELSLLALAHTPKRDATRPIEINDLQGSSALSNLCDSMFAIGRSAKDKNTRYIKQLKQRETEQLYGTENVIVCEIAKPNNFLQFQFKEFGEEHHHLKQLTDDERENREFKALEMFRDGKKNVDIAVHFGVTEGAVRKWKKKFQDSGVLEIVPNVPDVPSTNGTDGTNNTISDSTEKPQRSTSKPTPEQLQPETLELVSTDELNAGFFGERTTAKFNLIKAICEGRNITGSEAGKLIKNSIEYGLLHDSGNDKYERCDI